MKNKITLDQPLTYQIKVSGRVSENWSDWLEQIEIKVEDEVVDTPITSLTGTVDQAALQSLLRRLYNLGFPLISVNCAQFLQEENN